MPGQIDRRVAVTDSEALLQPGIELLRDRGVEVLVVPPGATSGEAATAAAGYPAAIVGLLSFGPAEIAKLRQTGILVRAGIGYDVIDVEAATAAGIWVANVPDYCVDEVADHAMLLLMGAWRRLPELEAVWRAGSWVNASLVPPVRRARGRRLGLIGFGRIGRAVAHRARGFGFEVVAHDPYVADDDLRGAGVSRGCGPAWSWSIPAAAASSTSPLSTTPSSAAWWGPPVWTSWPTNRRPTWNARCSSVPT
jgi:D-3-phosphoglycerate dehydrogenase